MGRSRDPLLTPSTDDADNRNNVFRVRAAYSPQPLTHLPGTERLACPETRSSQVRSEPTLTPAVPEQLADSHTHTHTHTHTRSNAPCKASGDAAAVLGD